MTNLFSQGACANNSSTASTTGASPVVFTGSVPSVFSNEEFGSVRVIMKEDGEPLFCLRDVCDILEVGKTSDIKARLDEADVVTIAVSSESSNGVVQNRDTIFITESGLYDVILDSRKPEAKRFRKWITSEVLPSIRKTGSYSVAQPSYQIPQTFAEALQLAADIQKENEKLLSVNKAQSAKIAEDKPKVAAYDVFMGVSDDLISIGDFAKILHTKWNDIKPHRLFAILREAKILKDSYFEKNIPYQKYIDKGYFHVKESTSTNSLGYRFISKQALITPKGQKYLLDKFMAARENDPEEQIALFEGEE